MDDDQAAIAVADAIRNSSGIKPETPPTAEELAEIEGRRERFRHYWHRQAEERRRVEEAERLAAQQEAAAAERARIERVRAEARESARQHYQQTLARDAERKRNAQIAQQQAEWQMFKNNLAQAEAELQRKKVWQQRQELLADLEKGMCPQPELETAVYNFTEIVESPAPKSEPTSAELYQMRRSKDWGTW